MNTLHATARARLIPLLGKPLLSGIPVHDPYDGHIISHVTDSNQQAAYVAIERANDVQTEWAQTSAHYRSKLLMDWHQLILANADNLANIITLENGKPLAEARGEVNYAGSFIQVLFVSTLITFSGLPKRLNIQLEG